MMQLFFYFFNIKPSFPADFGSAREFDASLKLTPVVCTLYYRAIEVLLGQKAYSKAIDMWSVGCILVELMTKKVLFKERSEINMIKTIYEVNIVFNRQLSYCINCFCNYNTALLNTKKILICNLFLRYLT